MKKASLVMFHGNINIAGRNGNNLDPVRDGCELLWHEPSGGLVVQWGEQHHYVPAVSIMSLTFDGGAAGTAEADSAQSPAPSPAPAAAEPQAPQSNLADSVLEEFQEGKDAMPNPKPTTHRRHR